MTERLSNLGYLLLIKEATKGVPLTPTVAVPLYDETMNTNGNFVDQDPIFGNKFATYNTLQGQRDHKGDVTVIAEPNTTGYFLDMLFTKISSTGSAPTTHVFAPSNTTNPNSYTMDISYANVVTRYIGVEASKMSPVWNKNEMQWKISLSALGSFQSRDIASVATTTLVLATTYDPAPNKGLVVGDLVRIYKSSTGATLDTTVATVNVDGVTVTLAASAAAFSAGDTISLRPATPTLSLLPSFLWAKNEWRFGATAAAALSAAQTRVEQGSTFDLIHNFESDSGAMRSGSFDPAALVRTTADLNVSAKKVFDTNEDIIAFNNLSKSALQNRHFSGPANIYEFRLTANHLKTDGTIAPNLKAGDILYSNINFHPIYDSSDAQGVGVTLLNTVTAY